MKRPIGGWPLLLSLTVSLAWAPPLSDLNHALGIARAETTQSSSPLRLVILPFKNITRKAEDAWLSDSFSESLTMGLAQVESLELIERSQIENLLREQAFNQSAWSDPEQAPRLGKLIGARVVVLGSYQKVGDQLQANARFVHLETGQIDTKKMAQVEGQFEDIFQLQKKLAQQLVRHLEVDTQPQDWEAVDKILTSTHSPEAYRLYMKGIQAKRYDDLAHYNQAVQYFQSALTEDPNYALAYAALSEVYSLKNRYSEIMRLTLPQSPIQMQGASDTELAQEYAEKALALNPDLPGVYRALALIAKNSGKKEKALKLIQQAIQLQPKNTDNLLAYLSIKYDGHNQGVPIAQIKTDLQSLNANLDNPWLKLALASLMFSQEIFKPYIELSTIGQMLEEVAEKLPDHPTVPLMQAALALAQSVRNPSENKEQFMTKIRLHLQQAESLSAQDATMLSGIASLWSHIGNFQKSRRLLEHAQTLQADNLFVMMGFSNLMAQQNQLDEARTWAEKAQKQDPKGTYPYFNWGITLLDHQQYAEALGAIETAYHHWENSPDGFNLPLIKWILGSLYLLNNRNDDALAIYQSLRHDPTYAAEAHQVLAGHAYSQKDFATALNYFETYLKLRPQARNQESVQHQYREYYLQTQLQANPNNVQVLNDLGHLAIIKKDYPQAHTYMSQAQKLAPNNPVVHYNLGYLYLQQEEWKAALQAFQKSLALKPDSIQTQFNLGLVYHHLGQNAQAKSHWQKILLKNPNHQGAKDALNSLEGL